jgi:hypothetical protein
LAGGGAIRSQTLPHPLQLFASLESSVQLLLQHIAVSDPPHPTSQSPQLLLSDVRSTQPVGGQ